MVNEVVVFHGLFGGWGRERLTPQGEVVAESYEPFETREECIEGARTSADEAARFS